MSKHRYTNMSALLPETKRMLESGMSHRAIEELKLEGERRVHNIFRRGLADYLTEGYKTGGL